MNQNKARQKFKNKIKNHTEFQDLVAFLFRTIRDELHPAATSLLRYDPKLDDLYFVHSETVKPDRLKGAPFPIDGTIMGWVVTYRKPLIVNNPDADSKLFDIAYKLVGIQVQNTIAIPIIINDDIFGVAELTNKIDSSDFTKEDLAEAENVILQHKDLLASAAPENIDSALYQLKEALRDCLDIEAISLARYIKENDNLVFDLFEIITRDDFKDIRVGIGQSLVGWVAKARKPLIIENADKDERFAQWADKITKFQTGSVICVPILDNKDLLGVIQTLQHRGSTVFTKNDQEFLSSIADTFAAEAGPFFAAGD